MSESDLDDKRRARAEEDEFGEVRAKKIATPLRPYAQRAVSHGPPWTLSDREAEYRAAYLASLKVGLRVVPDAEVDAEGGEDE